MKLKGRGQLEGMEEWETINGDLGEKGVGGREERERSNKAWC